MLMMLHLTAALHAYNDLVQEIAVKFNDVTKLLCTSATSIYCDVSSVNNILEASRNLKATFYQLYLICPTSDAKSGAYVWTTGTHKNVRILFLLGAKISFLH